MVQLVNRLPLPLRQWFGVPKRRNPKAIANFVRSYSALYKADRSAKWREKAVILADWLLRNESRELNAYQGVGRGWGYHFPWQSRGFYAARHTPNALVSANVGEAMLSVFEITGKRKYLDAAFGIRDYLLRALPTLLENDREKCIGYTTSGLRWRVIPVNAVVAGYLARLAVRTADRELAATSQKMITWVCDRINEDHTWDLTSPREQSGIGPDNHHTGRILDGIHDYMTYTGDASLVDVYSKALDTYEKSFFTAEGAPKWKRDRVYPADIQAAAQGIITFTKAAQLDPKYAAVAEKISRWTFQNLHDEKSGRFYYQKRSFFIWKLDLMRWNNSWMMRALSESSLLRTATTTKSAPVETTVHKEAA